MYISYEIALYKPFFTKNIDMFTHFSTKKYVLCVPIKSALQKSY